MNTQTAPKNPETTGLSEGDRLFALDMVKELQANANRHHCLSSTITDKLTPEPGEDSTDFIALCLAEILEERLSDPTLLYGLKRLLEGAGVEAALKG